ncbi:PLP-dependent cysteine synthase family protein [Microbacterium sp. NPDC056057]|uniref:PLP-dependent cysteine synthase family protein n=1 Tax=Microbacterium sp. NPDC056057 TaxID=3345699 RepID=UPI0035E1E9A8
MTRYESVIESIGGTPLVRVHRLAAGLHPRVYVKLEHQNPGGSVKDRAALSMIRAAERDGSLRPGGTVVEVTSGNTGVGLALVGAHLGYRAVIFTSSRIAVEKIRLLRAYGADVRLVDAFVPKGHPDSLGAAADRFVDETPGAWRADQYDNPANPAAHVGSTGPEIWADTEGAVTHFVASVGTGGTISGTGRALKALSDGAVRVIAADPFGSSYSGGDGSPKYVEGAGHTVHPEAEEDVWPRSFDLAAVDEYITVDDREAIFTARRAAREEGLLLGGSAGTALAAALRLAERLGPDDVIVALAPDSGRNALSTYYDDEWLADRGFVIEQSEVPTLEGLVDEPAPRVGLHLTVAEAVARLDERETDAAAPVLAVYRRADHEAPIPALDVAGLVTLDGLRRALESGFGEDLVRAHIVAAPPTVGIGRTADAALAALDASQGSWTAASVLRDGRIVGVTTRETLVAHAARAGRLAVAR